MSVNIIAQSTTNVNYYPVTLCNVNNNHTGAELNFFKKQKLKFQKGTVSFFVVFSVLVDPFSKTCSSRCYKKHPPTMGAHDKLGIMRCQY